MRLGFKFSLGTGRISLALAIIALALASCDESNDELAAEPSRIFHKVDGRSVFAGDLDPVALDMNGDGKVDYTIFAVLTADSNGDHLYVGINPIEGNTIKSGPPLDHHFMNMGFLIAETRGAVINKDLTGSQQWTSDHSILVLRHTNNDDSVWYEGDWKDGTESIVAIRHMVGDVTYYGWLKLQFNKDTEYITLTEYAYNLDSGKSIKAGEKD